MRDVAAYADGIGVCTQRIVNESASSIGGQIVTSELVYNARRAGLFVHAYTFRADSLPPYVATYEELLELFLCQIGIDGVFADQPDRAVALLRSRSDPNDLSRCRDAKKPPRRAAVKQVSSQAVPVHFGGVLAGSLVSFAVLRLAHLLSLDE